MMYLANNGLYYAKRPTLKGAFNAMRLATLKVLGKELSWQVWQIPANARGNEREFVMMIDGVPFETDLEDKIKGAKIVKERIYKTRNVLTQCASER